MFHQHKRDKIIHVSHMYNFEHTNAKIYAIIILSVKHKLDVNAIHTNPLQCADRIYVAKLLEIVLLSKIFQN